MISLMEKSMEKHETLHRIQGSAGLIELKIEFPNENERFQELFNQLNQPFQDTIGIICHPHPLYQGSMDNKVVTTISRAFKEMGLIAIRFNFRGVGNSEGVYGNIAGEIEDLKAVISWVKNHFPNKKYGLAGFSFGSYISANLASIKEKNTDQEENTEFLLSIAAPVQNFDFDSLPLPLSPWLIIHGDQDELTPLAQVQTWFDKIKERKKDAQLIVIPGASHFFHGKLIELKTEIKNNLAI